MRNYEVIFIIHPDLDESAFNELVERVQGWITEAGGTVSTPNCPEMGPRSGPKPAPAAPPRPRIWRQDSSFGG